MKYTANCNLKKPEGTDTVNIDDLNANADILDNNINSLSKQINNLAAYAVASGTNTYVATITGIAALTEGFSIKIKFMNANTGASTLNINGLGAKSILKGNGNALSSGNIKAGQICNLVYNGSNFQLLGEGGEYGTATASDVLSGKTIGTDAGVIEGTMPIAPTYPNSNIATDVHIYAPNESSDKRNNVFVMVPKGYYDDTWLGYNDPNLIISNIKAGVGIGLGKKIIGTAPIPSGNAAAEDVLSGKSFSNNSNVGLNGTMLNQGSIDATLTAQGQQYTVPAGYHSGAGKVKAYFSNLSAGNIKSGVNIGGVVGTVEPAPESIIIEAVNNRSDYIKYEWVNFIGFGTVGAVKSFKYYKDPITGTWPAITFYIRGEIFHLQDSATFTLNGVAKKYYDIGSIEGRYGTYELSAFVPNNTIINGDVIRITFPFM